MDEGQVALVAPTCSSQTRVDISKRRGSRRRLSVVRQRSCYRVLLLRIGDEIGGIRGKSTHPETYHGPQGQDKFTLGEDRFMLGEDKY